MIRENQNADWVDRQIFPDGNYRHPFSFYTTAKVPERVEWKINRAPVPALAMRKTTTVPDALRAAASIAITMAIRKSA